MLLWTMTASRLVVAAQPQALASSPGEKGEMPGWNTAEGGGGNSVLTKM